MNRRRFLAISAAALAAPAARAETVWTGHALGAEVRLTIAAPPDLAARAIARTRDILTGIEALFSLYDPTSALSRLNRTGQLPNPAPDVLTLCAESDRLHAATEGRFDPTIQPLWRALATGTDPGPARAALGWSRVQVTPRDIRLAPGQALSFNGIAQGYATDRVAAALRGLGLTQVLVDIGEYAALGGPWTLQIADPQHGPVATRRLTDGAIATSSPSALLISGQPHILDPTGQTPPRWSSVSVEADTATLADGLSTALCLADRAAIARIAARLTGLGRITLVDAQGDITTL